MRAGGRRVRFLRGSKGLANWARAASEAVLLCAEDWRAIWKCAVVLRSCLDACRRAPELLREEAIVAEIFGVKSRNFGELS